MPLMLYVSTGVATGATGAAAGVSVALRFKTCGRFGLGGIEFARVGDFFFGTSFDEATLLRFVGDSSSENDLISFHKTNSKKIFSGHHRYKIMYFHIMIFYLFSYKGVLNEKIRYN